MGTMIGNGTDVVSFLKAQHEQVKLMFQGVLSAHGDLRTKAFNELRRTLAVHETAEEEIIHPAARRVIANGDALVAARLKEENEAKKALAALEKLDVDSDEFEQQFKGLQAAVIAHAESEEREEFSKLATTMDEKRLQQMRKAAEFAEKVAPTRPHPGLGESATANMLAGPFASMLDRARDAIGKH
ncbi:MAG TPA: hemerythrin domain-containing protein [Polyangiaceae bacterium]